MNKSNNCKDREWSWDGHVEAVESDEFEDKEHPHTLNVQSERQNKKRGNHR